MVAVEQYLKPELASQIKRLDLRAELIVRGFLQGLHASPFQGFSVEFSEHRRYVAGDDPKDIDWLVYAKTDKYYIKKFESETNITGYLVMDLSQSMGFTHRQQLTKLDYSICLAAALAYLMIMQQDPVGLVTFDTKIRASLPPKSRRGQLPNILSLLTKMKTTGQTDLAASLKQLGAMVAHRSLIMIFTDLLTDVPAALASLRMLRHSGHDIILFHVLDESEVNFSFEGKLLLQDPETGQQMQVEAAAVQKQYQAAVAEYRDELKKGCAESRIDYVPLDTSMPYDRALMEYLHRRKDRG